MKKAAEDAVDLVFRPGFKYSKAEVLLVHLCYARKASTPKTSLQSLSQNR